MDEAEADILKAEVIALQAVLMSVFRRLATDRAELAPLFCQAFDEAETILAGVAVKLGLDVPLPSMTGAMTVLEEFRRAVLNESVHCQSSGLPRSSPRRTPGSQDEDAPLSS